MSLVGHWPLNEQSGRANDLSGEGNHGSVSGTTRGVAGKSGLTSYSFDGTDDYVHATGTNTIGTGPFAVSFWIRKSSSVIDRGSVTWDEIPVWLQRSSGSQSVNVYFDEVNNGKISVDIRDNNNNVLATLNSESDINDGNWHHISVIRNNSDVLKFVIDGNVEKSALAGGNLGSVETLLGSLQNGSGDYNRNYRGILQDFRIYDHALTPKEIRTLYEQGARGSAKPDGVSRYELEGDATDSWGSNDGTVNGATFVDGKFGQAASFDGTDDNINTGYGSGYGGPMSISAWVNTNTISENGAIAHSYDGDGGPYNLILYIRNNGVLRARRFDGSSADLIEHSITESWVGNWRHVVGTYDGDQMELYVDSVKVGLQDDTIGHQSSTSDYRIGSDAQPSMFFDGKIDDVRFYERALTPEEVSAIYNSWSDVSSPASDGVAYYPLDGDASDQWGTNDGTVSGATVTGDAIRGRAYSFDGTDDYISLGNWEVPSNFTITSWVKPTALDNNDMIFDQWFNSSSTGNVLFRLESGTPILYIKDSGGNNHTISGDNLTTDSWYFLTVSWDGSELRLTVNGVVVDTKNLSITRNTVSDDTYIGARQSATVQYFDGNIDDVRVYNRGLSLHEIHQLYLWGTRGRDLRPDLVSK